jgi:hypothetical protein
MMHIRKRQKRKTLQLHRDLSEKVVVVVESRIENSVVTGPEATAKRVDENETMEISAMKIHIRQLLVGAKIVTNETRNDTAPHLAPLTVRRMEIGKERPIHPPERSGAAVKVMTLVRKMKGRRQRQKEPTMLPLGTLMARVLNKPGMRMVVSPTTNCQLPWIRIRTLSASKLLNLLL